MPQTPTLETRLATWVIEHPLAQSFSYRTVETLLSVARGDSDVDAATAHRLLALAMEACIAAEILAGRETRT